jgi:uncharacterized membrane protein YbhN (UPF0104 family)
VTVVGWMREVLGQMGSISVPILLIALALHTAETLLNALAWRNILRRAYPDSGVSYRLVLGAYGGGVGLNAILPAQVGTFAMLGLYRARIRGSTAAGLLGASVAQNAFFLGAGGLVCAGLVEFRPELFSLPLGSLTDHAALALAVAAVVAPVTWAVVRRLHGTWPHAREGAAILTTPRVYVSQVLVVEMASYLARIGVTAAFMRAYGVPASLENVLLIVAANAVTSTSALTPGGVGAQQALATAALRNTASSGAVTAFSLGQQLVLAAWDILFGLVVLWSAIGWAATRRLVRAPRNSAQAPAAAAIVRAR